MLCVLHGSTLLDLIVFSVDGNRMAINLEIVERVVSSAALAPVVGAPPVVLGLLNLHGIPVPVISMRIKLNLNNRAMYPSDEIIILRRRGCILGLAVDDVEGVSSDVEIFPFDSATETTAVSATARLDDGLVMVQNVEHESFAIENENIFLLGGGQGSE